MLLVLFSPIKIPQEVVVRDSLRILKKYWWKVVVAIVMFLLVGAAIHWKIAADRHLRLSATAQQFDATPDAWVSRPQDFTSFREQLLGRRIAAVGVSFPLILYNTTNGEKHSTRLPCNWGDSCDAMREVNELLAKDNIKLAALDVDARPIVERLVDTGRSWLANLVLISMQASLVFIWVSYLRARTEDVEVLKDTPSVRFTDVIGASEAKQSLATVTNYLKDPDRYTAVGAKAPRGVLMMGPPGTGKTLLAQALAGECGAKFISIDGSYFTSKFYGSGVEKVKSIFELARKNAPCLVFIDEIDGIGVRRGGDGGAGVQEENRIINRILVEMDGFTKTEGVIVVAATNHVQNMDPAMRRAGRFDFLVNVQMPNQAERRELFDLYLKKVRAEAAIDTLVLARIGMGLSPADISNLINKAASVTADAGRQEVTQEDLMLGLKNHQLGGSVNSVSTDLTEIARRRVAVHEAGHALVSHVLGAGAVDHVSIEPRGQSLGATYVSRTNEDPLVGAIELHSGVAGMLAGRQAELLVLGEASTGAGDDLKRATARAYQMVGELGLGETFGSLSVAGLPMEAVGGVVGQRLVDDVRTILAGAEADCKRVLTAHRIVLDALTAKLELDETISGRELHEILSRASNKSQEGESEP